MGTTATVAGVLGSVLYLAQVGDSRAYLVRGGVATQLTKDQSLMQRLVDAGELTEEEAEHSERRNIILQALGPDARIRVDLTWQELCRGDTLVICSDGLSGQVKREEIGQLVKSQAQGDLEASAPASSPWRTSAADPITSPWLRPASRAPGLSEPAEVGDASYQHYPTGDPNSENPGASIPAPASPTASRPGCRGPAPVGPRTAPPP